MRRSILAGFVLSALALVGSAAAAPAEVVLRVGESHAFTRTTRPAGAAVKCVNDGHILTLSKQRNASPWLGQGGCGRRPALERSISTSPPSPSVATRHRAESGDLTGELRPTGQVSERRVRGLSPDVALADASRARRSRTVRAARRPAQRRLSPDHCPSWPRPGTVPSLGPSGRVRGPTPDVAERVMGAG